MKILFCTDGSEISMDAFHNLSILIPEAVIDIICVIDWSFLPTSMNIESESYSKAYENIADSVLNFAEKAILEKNMTIGKKVKSFGSAVEGILEQLENDAYDLVLVGSHGKKGIQKWLGSVSRQVISNSEVPVFISKKRTKGKKVILTVDGTEASYNAIRQSLKLINMKDKEIFIVSIKESTEILPVEVTMDKNWLESIEKQQKIHATKAINQAKSILEKENISVQNEILLTGNPAQKIIEFAEKENADLIIMGARTRTDLSKLLLGSVSKRVLENVTSDVLIISK
jgi:nucleotide-binding universal stress UspA family protein